MPVKRKQTVFARKSKIKNRTMRLLQEKKYSFPEEKPLSPPGTT